MSYLLPTHPSIPNADPLGILDDEAPQSAVLNKLLETASADNLPALIEDIAYTIHGNGSIDTTELKGFLDPTYDKAISSIFLAARILSAQFPTNTLIHLKEDGDRVTCTGAQINALLAHQLLGTLNQCEGVTWGIPCFTDYYKSNPAHPQAVQGYLTTLFSHFNSGGYQDSETFSFSMHTTRSMPDPALCDIVANINLNLVAEELEPSEDASDDSTIFVLVAAHSEPGPGATGTQEERLQNASLALSTSALFAPKLPEDGAVVTSAFPVHAGWKGHNRTARLDSLIDPENRPKRHYILADALMLDELKDHQDQAGMRDLQDGRVEREVRKLYAAFSGARKIGGLRCVIETGPWGCGAFGGNVFVKTVCIMIAAAMTGVEIRYSLLEGRTQDVSLVKLLLEKRYTAVQLWEKVRSEDTKRATSDVELSKCFDD